MSYWGFSITWGRSRLGRSTGARWLAHFHLATSARSWTWTRVTQGARLGVMGVTLRCHQTWLEKSRANGGSNENINHKHTILYTVYTVKGGVSSALLHCSIWGIGYRRIVSNMGPSFWTHDSLGGNHRSCQQKFFQVNLVQEYGRWAQLVYKERSRILYPLGKNARVNKWNVDFSIEMDVHSILCSQQRSRECKSTLKRKTSPKSVAP